MTLAGFRSRLRYSKWAKQMVGGRRTRLFRGAFMSVYSAQLKQLSPEQLRFVSGRNKKATLLWIECGSCNGESMAILGAEGPGKTGDNLSDFLEGRQVRLLWHPSLSETSPKEAAEIIDRILAGEEELTILCVEGSIINGPHGTGMYDTFDGRPKRDIIRA